MNHKAEDINIGDEIIFKSTESQSNHDEYWSVTGKTGDRIHIELKKSSFDESWTVHIKAILYVIPLSKSK